MTDQAEPVLLDGQWVTVDGTETFVAADARTGESLGIYPICGWEHADAMLEAGVRAYEALSAASWDDVAAFVDRFADRIDERADDVCTLAERETALPLRPRLLEVELPRTTRQLRLAAEEARSRRWTMPTLSPEERIASMFRPMPGPVVVFGPNNFPLAFNGVSGGDAAAALATGHPVIAKAHPLHPGTTALLAEEARAAAEETPGIPAAMVQLAYHTDRGTGLRLVGDARVAASAFTGSRNAGVRLKESADLAGKPIYLEMSSLNPVVVLPGAVEERGTAVAAELAASATLGSGQFCTQPGIVFVPGREAAASLRSSLAEAMREAACGPLLSPHVRDDLESGVPRLEAAGAEIVMQQPAPEGEGARFPATLLATDARAFLADPETHQTELFGPVTLLVACADVAEVARCLHAVEGNLTGSIYSAEGGSDEAAYASIAPLLEQRVGRLLNDKPPTGVTVTAAMNHGGPYPATGHPGFTAVGPPASMRRFGMLQSFDNVRDRRLPEELQAANPLGLQRYVEGVWTTAPVGWGEALRPAP